MKLNAQMILAAVVLTAAPCVRAQSPGFTEGDKSFLKETAQDDIAEVKMAELALKTSKDPTVTTLAKRMLDDHKRMLDETKAIAAKGGFYPPDGPSASGDGQYLELQAMSGGAFDKRYVHAMVGDHHKDLEAARAEHERTKNEAVRELAARTQETMASDVEMIERIATKMGA